MKKFNDIGLPKEIISALENLKITEPTEVQKKAIPLAIEGKDILASSQTGSGKTMAYLLPIISLLHQEQIANIKSNDCIAIILAPTRELASQVRDSLSKITSQFKINSAVLIGGESIGRQIVQLRKGARIVIGTPGRVIDHLTQGTLKLDKIKVLVLDEMDRMLDMGMKEQIRQINKSLPFKRQVMMFSATVPKHIIESSNEYLKNPERITIGSATKAASSVSQEMIRMPSKEKNVILFKQLDERQGSIIIFVKTKRGADELAKTLRQGNHKAEAIHGDLNQRRRERALLDFRKMNYRIMVATDVAARGLDIPHTQHVINYDLPMTPEDYLHRIGRTGRAGATGFALSLIAPDDESKWRAIDRLMTKGESINPEHLFKKRVADKVSNNNSRDFKGAYPRKNSSLGSFKTSKKTGNRKFTSNTNRLKRA